MFEKLCTRKLSASLMFGTLIQSECQKHRVNYFNHMCIHELRSTCEHESDREQFVANQYQNVSEVASDWKQ